MVLLLMIGCGLEVLYICTDIIQCLVYVKFALVVSLPGGLVAQKILANSQSATNVTLILQEISANMTVNLKQILSLTMN